MTIRVLGLSAALAVALSGAAFAQASVQGSVTEVQEGGRKVVLKTSDGKTTTVSVSGSRTKVTVGGAAGSRESIKAGMTCTAAGPAGADATALDCK
ncbi:MAG TPA: hypothetical protein VHN20_08095 [Beijerinckiaceae bacterium]|nr:hypothetical protein [Beijerinckiaceae bacterium]